MANANTNTNTNASIESGNGYYWNVSIRLDAFFNSISFHLQVIPTSNARAGPQPTCTCFVSKFVRQHKRTKHFYRNYVQSPFDFPRTGFHVCVAPSEHFSLHLMTYHFESAIPIMLLKVYSSWASWCFIHLYLWDFCSSSPFSRFSSILRSFVRSVRVDWHAGDLKNKIKKLNSISNAEWVVPFRNCVKWRNYI